MKYSRSLYVYLLLFILIINAQPVSAQMIFQKRYYLNDQTWFNSIVGLNSDQVMVFGTTLLNPSTFRTVILKLDTSGVVVDEKYLFFSNGHDMAQPQAVRNSDSTISIAGTINSFSNANFSLVRLDIAGNIIFAKEYDLEFGDGLVNLIATRDSGSLLFGDAEKYSSPLGYNTGMALKLDRNGNVEWIQKYGSAGKTSLMSAIENDDGSFVFLATTTCFNDTINNTLSDILLFSTDAVGNILNCKLHNTPIFDDEAYRIFPGGSKDIIIAISTSEFSYPKQELCLFSFDSLLNFKWGNKYSGFSGGIGPDRFSFCKKTFDNGFLFAVNSRFVKLDSLGNFDWQNRISSINGIEYSDLAIDYDSTLFLIGSTGTSQLDGWMVKNSTLGEVGCNSNVNDLLLITPVSFSFQDTLLNYHLDSAISISFFYEDTMSINTSTECLTYVSDESIIIEDDDITVFPTIADETVYVQFAYNSAGQIRILSLDGKIVFETEMTSSITNDVTYGFDVSQFASGVYIVLIMQKNLLSHSKFIKR